MSYAQESNDRDAGEQQERQVINVSPFVAKFQIGTMPGTRARRHELKPGEAMWLQAGYCDPFIGESLRPVRATIESLTERHAWEGKNAWDKDGKPYWAVKPGPQLPMVVEVGKADEYRAKWRDAMTQKEQADKAPLRMTLQRQDGTDVQVEAEIAPPPRVVKPPVVGGFEQDAPHVIEEPPPDDDLPVMASAPPAQPQPPVIPKKGGKP